MTHPPALEEGNASDVSMVNDSLIQHDSDVMVEEEREEAMDTGAPASPTAPAPPKESPDVGRLRGLGTLMTSAARHLRKARIKTCTHDLDLN